MLLPLHGRYERVSDETSKPGDGSAVLQMLSRNHRLKEVKAAREEARDEAEAETRHISRELVRSALEDAAEHQVKALPGLAKHEAAKVEADATERSPRRSPC